MSVIDDKTPEVYQTSGVFIPILGVERINSTG